MVSFCWSLFKSELLLAKLCVSTTFFRTPEKFTSCVITSQSLYRDWLGKAFLSPLKYSESMLDAFKQGIVESELYSTIRFFNSVIPVFFLELTNTIFVFNWFSRYGIS